MENKIAKSNDNLLEEFMCPICTNYMLPPIRQCLNGHCFCHDCFDKISNCAICRAPKSEFRPIVLEKIQSFFTFPCLYELYGCKFQASGEVISLHQQHCKFSKVPCPLRFHNCQWRGEKTDVAVHCKTEHPHNIFFSNNQKLMSSRFRCRIDRIYYILFFVFNKIFRCTWDLDKKTGLMRLAIYHLGKPREQDGFSFEVSYEQEGDNKEMITVRAPCHPMEDDSERFLKDKYFVLHHEVIKNFCDRNGDLNYSIKILEKK